MTPALELRDVRRRFGDFTAVDGVDLAVAPGERCALLGPNGAGKTTLLNLISGRLALSGGSVRVGGRDVTRDSAARRARLRVGRSFQKTNVFPALSLLENVRLGVRGGADQSNWNPWRAASADRRANDEAASWLHRVGIGRPPSTPARDLSYGEQRQLELAITMAMRPEIVLLDEPTAGMSQAETRMILDLLQALLERSTVVIVEHDLSVVDRIAQRVIVLERGRILCEGTPASIREDERVQSAYLKGARHA